MIEKIQEGMDDTKKRLAELKKKAIVLVEETSSTIIASTEVPSPTKKMKTDVY